MAAIVRGRGSLQERRDGSGKGDQSWSPLDSIGKSAAPANPEMRPRPPAGYR